MTVTVSTNPFLVVCPCCGELLCTKCAEIEARLGELCGCQECNARARLLEKRYDAHIAKYDHEVLRLQEEQRP